MNELILICQDEQRRQQVRQKLNGLDYLEVDDSQTVLYIYFLGNVPTGITADKIRIEGGKRIRDIQVVGHPQVECSHDPTQDSYLKIQLNKYGDFSTYTLRLGEKDAKGNFTPLPGFDSRYSQLEFTFKTGCSNDLDCQTQPVCPPVVRVEPEINYLAKDYASFRQLILDRLSLILPDWQERHVPDLGIALVELLAYVGDYLSYYQDAVATEAYLQTARQRISVRRHARLVDYLMHEGCNARTWVWIDTDSDTSLEPQDIYFITTYPGAPEKGKVLREEDDLKNIPKGQYEVFEPVTTQTIQLYAAHSTMHFYTWGDRLCCLPKGATSATLRDEWIPPEKPDSPKQDGCPPDPCQDTAEPQPTLERKLQHLKKGDILIFEEVKGAKTGNPADADPTHRHAVRLTCVCPGEDELYKQQVANVTQEMPTPVVEIEWGLEDALPFPLCISSIGPAPECKLIGDITLVRGNVILVDYGRTVDEDLKPAVPEKEVIAQCQALDRPADITLMPGLFRPHLPQSPLTFRQLISPAFLDEASASALLRQEPRGALPQIYLTSFPMNSCPQVNAKPTKSLRWIPTLDLLANQEPTADLFWHSTDGTSSSMQRFIAEMDNDGIAHLRFGDGGLGQKPTVGMVFHAYYRIGNGLAGNIGAEAIAHLVFRRSPQSGVKLEPHNPFPAQSGTPPEPLTEVKLFAPSTFRKDLQRAITAQDYADLVMRDFQTQVQKAAASWRWTGSWYEVLVAIDQRGQEEADKRLLKAIKARLYRYRRIGHDLQVKSAVYVSLAIAMRVCVLPDYLRGHVKAALLNVFSNRLLPDGKQGFFHPDNLTFGGGIYLSQLVATAQAVAGVMSVTVTRLKRLAEVPHPSQMPDSSETASPEILDGFLGLAPQEIARLDNDPSFPENGILILDLVGGR